MIFEKKIILQPKENVAGQFIRSIVTGGFASLVDIMVFNIFTNLLDVNHIASNTLSFAFGLVVNYLLSRKWVFNCKTNNVKRDFLLFSLVGIIGLILSNILIFILVDMKVLYYLMFFPGDRPVKATAKIAAVVIVFFWNFAARKKLVFTNQNVME